MSDSKVIAFDLDGTLCDTPSGGKTAEEKYLRSTPRAAAIAVVNSLYDRGHTIVIYTARGMLFLAKDRDAIVDELYELTKNQLRAWGIKHHRLIMGKPFYDVLIDDKVMYSEDASSVDAIERFVGCGNQQRNG